MDDVDAITSVEVHKETKPHKPSKPLKTVILEHVIDSLGIEMSYNQFTAAAMIKYPNQEARAIENDDEMVVRDEMAARDAGVYPGMVTDRLQRKAKANSYHPVLEYLDKLHWDGENRLDTWLHRYMGAENTNYTRKVGKAVLVAAVRRVKDPGCKFDQAMVLVGQGGSGKSSMIRALCPKPEWFTSSLPLSSPPKQVIEGTRGIWIVEAEEMLGNNSKNLDAVKAFLSRQVDGPVRLAYSRHSVSRPRQFIVIGTTNNWKPIIADEGARRFWPVKAGSFEHRLLERERDQLWAEACVAEMRGDLIHITSEDNDDVEDAQRNFTTLHPWRELIGEKIDALPKKSPIPVADVWRWVGIEISKQTHEQSKALVDIMHDLKYEKSNHPEWVPELGKRVRVFRRLTPFDSFDTRLSTIPEDLEEKYGEPVYGQSEWEQMQRDEEEEL